MSNTGTFAPRFGEADLSNCEREQIHLAGSIQPHGVLLVLRDPDFVVVQASENASAMLGVGDVLGRSVAELGGDLAESIAPHLGLPMTHPPFAVRCAIGPEGRSFDVLLHRPPQGGLVVELEAASGGSSRTTGLEAGIDRIMAAYTLRDLCDEAARIVRETTAYDRVMVYRFDRDGHGEVYSEERGSGLEPFLGNRYPSTDIPQIARRLYERNRVRMLVDINYTPINIVPAISPITDQPLDMSMCLLRSISPIHVQYLKNMGVGATLVVSLMVGGRLWGLISCHHNRERRVPFQTRVACELLAEAIATRIAALESSARGQAELAVRRLEQRLIEAIPREGDWRGALFDGAQSLLQPLHAAGAALLLDDQVTSTGDVPGTLQIRAIGAWLDTAWFDPTTRTGVFSTASLGVDEPRFAELRASASGMVAAPLSGSPGDYLFWFRPERVRTVTWGGDPRSAVMIGQSPKDLSPRRSFAQWHQVVEFTSEPWSDADLAAAHLIGDTVKDVILQFRSVGLLVAQEQLDRVRGKVQVSELPVVVTDAFGHILLTNDSFRTLIGRIESAPLDAAGLATLFANPAEFGRSLRERMDRAMTWRTEASTRATGRPFSVRMDPVFSAPSRLSGFVLLFSDLSQKRAAEAARQSFQDKIVSSGRLASSQFDRRVDALVETLFAVMVENAQLAALEITDGVDLAQIPDMLDSVKASILRSKRALDHFVLYAKTLSSDRNR